MKLLKALSCLLFLSTMFSEGLPLGCAEAWAQNTPVFCDAKQIFGKFNYEAYSLVPPQGYWHCPGRTEPQGTLSERFVFTFFGSKEDIPQADNDIGKKPVGAFFQFAGGPCKLGPAYDYFKEVYVEGKMLDTVRVANIPDPLRSEFQSLENWTCKYIEPSEGHRGVYSSECITMKSRLIGISVSAFSQREVFEKALLLRDMVASFFEK